MASRLIPAASSMATRLLLLLPFLAVASLSSSSTIKPMIITPAAAQSEEPTTATSRTEEVKVRRLTDGTMLWTPSSSEKHNDDDDGPYPTMVWGVGAATTCVMYAPLFRDLAKKGVATACPTSANPQHLVKTVRFLSAEGISFPIALGGHSYGGNTAQVAASMLGEGEVVGIGNFPGGLCPLGVFGCNAHGVRVPFMAVSPSSDVNQIGVKENVFNFIQAPKIWVSMSAWVGHSDVMKGAVQGSIGELALLWFRWLLLQDTSSAEILWRSGQLNQYPNVIDVDIEFDNARRLLSEEEEEEEENNLAAFATNTTTTAATNSTSVVVMRRTMKLAAKAFLEQPRTQQRLSAAG